MSGQVNNSSLSHDEREANDALESAHKAISAAIFLAERARYGSNVLGPLADAVVNVKYALDTATGCN